MLTILWLLACGTPESESDAALSGETPPAHRVGIANQAGEKHPPIPANNPGWNNVSKDFKPTPHAYGEERWDDVSMRVIGHLSQATRDLARLEFRAGNPATTIALFDQLAGKLSKIDLGEKGLSQKVRDLHINAAHFHAAIHRKKQGEQIDSPKLLGQNSRNRWNSILGEPSTVQDERPWKDIKIDSFDDFRDRHQLRLQLTEYWLDTVDPFSFSDPWGYWRPAVADATATTLQRESISPLQLEEAYPLQMTVNDIGRLPTGDSYVDTAGGAGPLSIGSLSVLGLEDKEHHERLQDWVSEINTLTPEKPAEVVANIREHIDTFNGYKHGSRFYNIKQLINAGTRHLARNGHYAEALTVFQLHRPLHKQDWLCPNREAIQLGIEGKLAALAGNDILAREKLRLAIQESDVWLNRIAREKARPQKPRPPGRPPPR